MEKIKPRAGLKTWEKVVYFFPFQLLFVHLKKNILLLAFWLLLFALVTQNLALKYGIPYLFLFPEYLGKVNFLSHFAVGLVTGSFIMAFNISSYVVNGFRFPFLATLNRPFVKYCLNNFVIPALFSLVYIYCMARFQWKFEGVAGADIFFNVVGFISGNLLFIGITLLYFSITNKNLLHFFPEGAPAATGTYLNPVRDLFSNRRKWDRAGKSRKEWTVTTYLSSLTRINLARESAHYNLKMCERVFEQNRVNASYFQIIVIVALFLLGFLHEYAWLKIPAAASILLFFTMMIMLISAVYSWLRGWTNVVLLAAFIIYNLLSRYDWMHYQNQAYGLDYNAPHFIYTQENIQQLQENKENLLADHAHGVALLENWKRSTGEEKPVMVILNTTGGGLRAAVWTMQALLHGDSITNGNLWEHLHFISGSSGGMIGAAYLREYYWRKKKDGISIEKERLIGDMAADLLNPIAVTAVLNDVFFRFRDFDYAGHEYTLDRAYAFELQLNRNTRGWLNWQLKDYAKAEFEAKIPMMVLAPTISNDGRRLVISSQPVSFLCYNDEKDQINENIEFQRMCAPNDPGSLSFISALRMNATFPYVFPAASLPTIPATDIMDAGIRDNFGLFNTLKYLFQFRDWLKENTSKVVIVQVRDQEKFVDLKAIDKPSVWQKLMQPVGSFYNSLLDVQNYQMDDQLRMADEWFKGELEVVDLVLDRSETNPISLSWHLTQSEKERIANAVRNETNAASYEKLEVLLNTNR